jgi:hypothetical protein
MLLITILGGKTGSTGVGFEPQFANATTMGNRRNIFFIIV